MSGRLEGKVAVVTGGASGIGLATVETFVREGCAVVFCDLAPDQARNVADEQPGRAGQLHYRNRKVDGAHDGAAIARRLGNATMFVPCDVTKPDELQNVIDTTIERYGKLDIMVNNAGIGANEGDITECEDEIFDRTIAVNLKAVWRGIKLAAPHIKANGGGSIVSTASISGLRGARGQGAYGASKGAVVNMTRVAAAELGRDFVRVNCICPGVILTPLLYANPGSDEPVGAELLGELMRAAQPLPRAGLPQDIANAALFLASDESSFLTGQALTVDGGLTAEMDSRGREYGIAGIILGPEIAAEVVAAAQASED